VHTCACMLGRTQLSGACSAIPTAYAPHSCGHEQTLVLHVQAVKDNQDNTDSSESIVCVCMLWPTIVAAPYRPKRLLHCRHTGFTQTRAELHCWQHWLACAHTHMHKNMHTHTKHALTHSSTHTHPCQTVTVAQADSLVAGQ